MASNDCDPSTDQREQHLALPRLLSLHQDAAMDWVASLSCGHTQHVRHQPPWQNRPWVLDAEQRQLHIGKPFACGWCNPQQSSSAQAAKDC